MDLKTARRFAEMAARLDGSDPQKDSLERLRAVLDNLRTEIQDLRARVADLEARALRTGG